MLSGIGAECRRTGLHRGRHQGRCREGHHGQAPTRPSLENLDHPDVSYVNTHAERRREIAVSGPRGKTGFPKSVHDLPRGGSGERVGQDLEQISP
jgi:hypothetical protein